MAKRDVGSWKVILEAKVPSNFSYRCACGSRGQTEKMPTPGCVVTGYTRIGCRCGAATPWCQSKSMELDAYLKERWVAIQKWIKGRR